MDNYPTPPGFLVKIPSGSLSFQIEKACESSTEQMNHSPLKVNAARWRQERDEAYERLKSQTAACREESGMEDLRPHAGADCAHALFDILGLKPVRINKTSGKASVDKETLGVYASQGVKLASLLLEARETQSHCSQLKEWEVFAAQGWVQANWKQTGTPHGRYSCENPNLQNRIHPIRHTVEADEGHHLLSLDLGQAEYVTWASLSKDQFFCDTILSGKDFHQTTWDEIKALVPGVKSFDKDERSSGKTTNFAILYRMQDFVLARRVGCPLETARKILDAHRKRAPQAWKYMEDILTQARANGNWISTRFGRERYLEDLSSRLKGARHEAEKTAWNHHNAGTAAEVLKIKQFRTCRALWKEFGQERVRLALQMHDELIFMVPDELMTEAKALALETFERPINGFLPFKTDCRTGKTWGEITK